MVKQEPIQEETMALEFKRLTEVDKAGIVELMNNPLVRRQIPLTSDDFDEAECEAFIAARERLWDEYD
jgi:hypothetical protein